MLRWNLKRLLGQNAGADLLCWAKLCNFKDMQFSAPKGAMNTWTNIHCHTDHTSQERPRYPGGHMHSSTAKALSCPFLLLSAVSRDNSRKLLISNYEKPNEKPGDMFQKCQENLSITQVYLATRFLENPENIMNIIIKRKLSILGCRLVWSCRFCRWNNRKPWAASRFMLRSSASKTSGIWPAGVSVFSIFRLDDNVVQVCQNHHQVFPRSLWTIRSQPVLLQITRQRASFQSHILFHVEVKIINQSNSTARNQLLKPEI